MAIWDKLLTDHDREVFRIAGYGSRVGYGKSPAIMVIDVNYEFIGDRPEPILESIKKYRHSCGEKGWQAVQAISLLLEAGRAAKVPVFYTLPSAAGNNPGWEASKNARAQDDLAGSLSRIVDEIKPSAEDVVICKERPSAFFGTSLISHLVRLGVDSLIVAGGSASGCIRATVTDAYSYNYKIAVVQEAVFDRCEASYCMSLFDMNIKYADVVSLDETLLYLEALWKNRSILCTPVCV